MMGSEDAEHHIVGSQHLEVPIHKMYASNTKLQLQFWNEKFQFFDKLKISSAEKNSHFPLSSMCIVIFLVLHFGFNTVIFIHYFPLSLIVTLLQV